MKAVLINQPGSLDNVSIGDVPVPTPESNQLLVKVRAAGVNPADWKIIEMGQNSWSLPKVAGLDVAGVVETVGAEASGFEPGDRVYYHGSFAMLGAFAEYALVPAHVVAKLPAAVDFEQAAALPTAGFTAYQIVEERLFLNAGDVVVVHAGSGGVGGFAIQLCKLRGATVIVTCSAANFEHVRRLGADHVVDYREDNLAEVVSEVTGGRGADAIIDLIGPAVGREAVAMLAYQGQLVCCCGLPDLADLQPLPRGIRITDIALGFAYVANDMKTQSHLARIGEAMAALVAEGKIDPLVTDVMAFDDAVEALRKNKTGRQRGKAVISLGN